MHTKRNLSFSKKLAQPLLISSLLLSSGFAHANEAEIKLADNTTQTTKSIEDLEQEEKVKARLKEIADEAKAAAKTANGYYVERRSNGTQKES